MNTTDSSRWTPQPRAAGATSIGAEAEDRLDLSEGAVEELGDEATGDMATSLGLSPQLTTGAVLDELVQQGHDIVACTADLGRPTHAGGFGGEYPDRYFDFDIAERNMFGAAAGLATTGHNAVIGNGSFCLALVGSEHVRHDICYPGLNVRMIGTPLGHRDGLVRHHPPLQRGHRRPARDRRPDRAGALRLATAMRSSTRPRSCRPRASTSAWSTCTRSRRSTPMRSAAPRRRPW
jgi:hypothetical protein